MKKYLAGFFLFLLMSPLSWADDFVPEGEDDVTFSANNLTLDADDTGGDIQLQFGESLSQTLEWDSTNANFEFSDSVDLQSNEIKNLRIENFASAPVCDATKLGQLYYNTTDKLTYSCDGVSVWNPFENALNATIEFPLVQARRTSSFVLPTTYGDVDLDTTDLENDATSLYHDDTLRDRINIGADGLYQIIYGYTAGGTATATHEARARVRVNDTTVLTGSESVNRNYQVEFSTTSASFLANLNDGDFITLQLQRDATVDETQDEIYFSIVKLEGIRGEKGDPGDVTDATGVSTETFTLDNDNTGGDVALQFGATLSESLTWDNTNAEFDLSDDLNLGGNELREVRIENLATAPVCDGTVVGKAYYNTTDSRLYTCNGSAWFSDLDQIQRSGRHYLYTDTRWTTWSNNSYGPSYYQWNQSSGTAVDPVVSWAGQGMWFPKGTIISKITVVGRANNTEITDVEQMWQFRYPNPTTRWESGIDNSGEDTHETVYRNFWVNNTTPGQPAFTGNINDITKREFVVNYTTPEDGSLDQIMQPVNTPTGTRYFYANTSIEYKLPVE